MSSKDLQIDWLRAFLAVVDTGSMTAASRQVSRSQSAVSMQLRKLEDSIGRPVLNRGSRQLSLTPAGYDLLTHARRLMEIHGAAVSALHGGEVSGRLTLGAPDDYVLHPLSPALRTFFSRYPGVEVTLVCEPSTVLHEMVARGEVDLALTTREHAHQGEVLYHEALVWAASSQHETWLREPLPIAVHGLSPTLRAEVLGVITGLGRQYRVVYNSPNIPGQLAAAECGMAVAVLTRSNVSPGLRVVDERMGLPSLPEVEVVLVRSVKSKRLKSVDALYQHLTSELRAGSGRQS